jgi:hypothetical protein
MVFDENKKILLLRKNTEAIFKTKRENQA